MGLPPNGWFLLGKIPSRNGWFRGSLVLGNPHICIILDLQHMMFFSKSTLFTSRMERLWGSRSRASQLCPSRSKRHSGHCSMGQSLLSTLRNHRNLGFYWKITYQTELLYGKIVSKRAVVFHLGKSGVRLGVYQLQMANCFGNKWAVKDLQTKWEKPLASHV